MPPTRLTKIHVNYIDSDKPPVLSHRVIGVASECDGILWILQNVPLSTAVSFDVQILSGPSWTKTWNSASELVTSGSPLGQDTVLRYKASISTMARGGVDTEEHQLAVPTLANGSGPKGDLIVLTARYDSGRKEGTVDKEQVVRVGDGLPVRWDFNPLKALGVVDLPTLKFTEGPPGFDADLGPFTAVAPDPTAPGDLVLTGTGDSKLYGHYTYTITATVPATPLVPAYEMIIVIDPGIDQLEPPAGMPPIAPPREDSPNLSRAVLEPPVGNEAPDLL